MKPPKIDKMHKAIPDPSEEELVEEVSAKKTDIMRSPPQNSWYEADYFEGDLSQTVDNNEIVDLEKIQVAGKVNLQPAVITQQAKRQNILSAIRNRAKQEKKKTQPNIGEFVLLLRNKASCIGTEEQVKKHIFQLAQDESIQDEDIMIFYRCSFEDLGIK